MTFAKGSFTRWKCCRDRQERSAQDSWDDACTASVPILASSDPNAASFGPNEATTPNKPKEQIEMFKNFLMDETGAELAEYAVAVALLVAIGMVVYSVLGQGISDANSQTGEDIQNASHTVTP
jgi:Flp pilus assembly pilin Flp